MRIFIRNFSIGLSTSIILIFSSAAWAACNDPRTPTSRYVVQGGEVYDKKTDLTWARCSVGQHWKEGIGCAGIVKTMTWDEAQRQGGGVWRVPTKDELLTLVATACKNPSINEDVFPDMDLEKPWYWTSTTDGASVAWDVYFPDGTVYNHYRTDTLAVRLVRGGQ